MEDAIEMLHNLPRHWDRRYSPTPAPSRPAPAAGMLASAALALIRLRLEDAGRRGRASSFTSSHRHLLRPSSYPPSIFHLFASRRERIVQAECVGCINCPLHHTVTATSSFFGQHSHHAPSSRAQSSQAWRPLHHALEPHIRFVKKTPAATTSAQPQSPASASSSRSRSLCSGTPDFSRYQFPQRQDMEAEGWHSIWWTGSRHPNCRRCSCSGERTESC